MSLTVPVKEIIEKSSDPLLQIHSSWERIPLSSVADILNGFAFKSTNFSQTKGFPLLRIRDVGKNNVETLYDGDFDPTFIVNPGDLVVGMDGDFRSSIWKGSRALLNQRVCKIIPIMENYDFKFLDLVLPGYLKAINEKTSAVTVKHLSSKSISEILLPLPPLHEQHRIVQKIEELFTDLDAGVQALEKAKVQVRTYRQAVLKAAVEGRLTEDWREKNKDELKSISSILEKIEPKNQKRINKKSQSSKALDSPELPDEWEWKTVDQVADIQTGATPLKSNAKYYQSGTIAWVTSGALNQPFVTEAETYITELAIHETNAKIFPIHTLLVAMYGEGKTRGKVSELLIEAATNQACAALIFDENTSVFRPYVKIFFEKNYNDVRKLSSGGVQPNLNLGIIKSTKIPFPSLEEQKFIVSEIERRFSVIDQIEKTIDQSSAQAEKLRQSILKKAFEGKLVPQDTEDEPASVLLERIKQEKTEHEVSNKFKRKSTSKLRTKNMKEIKNSETEIKHTGLYELLSSSEKGLTPKELWKLSALDIEDFYTQLKIEVEKGRILEHRPTDFEVFLEIKK